MDYGYVGAELAWKAQRNKQNDEGFNRKSYQLGNNKEVYDAELLELP
jgi:hypothetical protein